MTVRHLVAHLVLTNVHPDILFDVMKTIAITELRQRAADVIAEAGASDEPTVVLQRSRKAAYIVSPERYEREQKELRALRRALFLTEVREAEAEYRAGDAHAYDDMEALLDNLRS
jgi:prevent-host-death family protein